MLNFPKNPIAGRLAAAIADDDASRGAVATCFGDVVDRSKAFAQRGDFRAVGLIPARLSDDRLSPGAPGERSNAVWHCHELVPGVATRFEDGLVGVPNAMA